MDPRERFHAMLWLALLAIAMGLLGRAGLPSEGLPNTFQSAAALLAGYLLGPLRALLCVALFLAAGCAGYPIFGAGVAGLEYLLGPFGGAVLGLAPCAALAGLAWPDRSAPPRTSRLAACGLLGLLALCAVSLAWMRLRFGLDPVESFTMGILPLLPYDPLRVAAAMLCLRLARRFTPVPGVLQK